MIYPLFSIRDKLTGFMFPTPDQTEESAQRGFASAMNNNPTTFGFAPADYDLYCVGSFDSKTGLITGESPIKFICNGYEVYNEK